MLFSAVKTKKKNKIKNNFEGSNGKAFCVLRNKKKDY